MDVKSLTDRELLEGIYTMLQQVLIKVSEIDNDDKQFGMNLAANLLSSMVYTVKTGEYAN